MEPLKQELAQKEKMLQRLQYSSRPDDNILAAYLRSDIDVLKFKIKRAETAVKDEPVYLLKQSELIERDEEVIRITLHNKVAKIASDLLDYPDFPPQLVVPTQEELMNFYESDSNEYDPDKGESWWHYFAGLGNGANFILTKLGLKK